MRLPRNVLRGRIWNWEIEPWWEKIRSLAQMMLILLVVFLNVGMPYSCILHCNLLTGGLNTKSAIVVRRHLATCEQRLPDVSTELSTFPFLNMLLNIAVLGLDMIWRMIPKVQRTFENLLRCDQILQDMNLTPQEIYNAVSSIVKAEKPSDPHEKLTDDVIINLKRVCYNLWTLDSKFSLSIGLLLYFRYSISVWLIAWSLVAYYITVGNINVSFCNPGNANLETVEICGEIQNYENYLLLFNVIALCQVILLTQCYFSITLMTNVSDHCGCVILLSIYLASVVSTVAVAMFCCHNAVDSTICIASHIFACFVCLLPVMTINIFLVVGDLVSRRWLKLPIAFVVQLAILLLLVYETKFANWMLSPFPLFTIALECASMLLTERVIPKPEPEPYDGASQLLKNLFRKKDDNRIANVYLYHSERRLSLKTRAILFPTKMFRDNLPVLEKFISEFNCKEI